MTKRLWAGLHQSSPKIPFLIQVIRLWRNYEHSVESLRIVGESFKDVPCCRMNFVECILYVKRLNKIIRAFYLKCFSDFCIVWNYVLTKMNDVHWIPYLIAEDMGSSLYGCSEKTQRFQASIKRGCNAVLLVRHRWKGREMRREGWVKWYILPALYNQIPE